MSLHFTILPQRVRTAAADEMLLTTVTSHSVFPVGTRLVVDGDGLQFTRVTSESVFPTHTRVSTGDDATGSQTRVVSASMFGEHDMVEAPPDVSLHFTRLVGTSVFPEGTEMSEAPPDGGLRFTRVVSTSTIGSPELAEGDDEGATGLPDGDDDPEGIATGVIGSMI